MSTPKSSGMVTALNSASASKLVATAPNRLSRSRTLSERATFGVVNTEAIRR